MIGKPIGVVFFFIRGETCKVVAWVVIGGGGDDDGNVEEEGTTAENQAKQPPGTSTRREGEDIHDIIIIDDR